MDTKSNEVTEPMYLCMVKAAARIALREVETEKPTVPETTAFRELVGTLLQGYPDNVRRGIPRFNLFTPIIAESTWRNLAKATGFVEHWPSGATKDIEQVYLHIEVRCIMALDTVALYFENDQPNVLHGDEVRDAVVFCRALSNLPTGVIVQ